MKNENYHKWITKNWQGDGLFRKCIRCGQNLSYDVPEPSVGCNPNKHIMEIYQHLKP